VKLGTALNRALRDVVVADSDAALVALARQYARLIDEDEGRTARLGPKLLDVLVEMRLTPRARAGVIQGSFDDAGSKLDDLRLRRANRAEVIPGSAAPADA
jgi:hypothetical protein